VNRVKNYKVGILLSVFAGALLAIAPGFSEDNSAGRETLNGGLSNNEADAEKCTVQLGLIFSALKEYQKQKHELPEWLSDLVPDYLHDANLLLCPYVYGTGTMRSWRKDLTTFLVFEEAKPTSYTYEFSTGRVRGPDTNCREHKESQMQVLGPAVPIVRCVAHTAFLNLAFDGPIYKCIDDWEDLFAKNTNDQRILYYVLPKDTAPIAVRELLRPRPWNISSLCLDLSNYFDATLYHLSQMQYQGKPIESITNGVQIINGIDYEIRALIHLTAKDFPIPFPETVKGISVGKRCSRIHILHGTMGDAPPGSKIATYLFNKENGEALPAPIIYGKDVKTRWFEADDPAEAKEPKPALVSPPDRVGPSGKSLRLYVKTWENPQPNVKVQSIDFTSPMTTSAPFIVAITTE